MSNARNLARLLPNTSGQLPDAAMSSGSVLQVVQSGSSVNTTTSVQGSFVNTSIAATITPASPTSKILILTSVLLAVKVNGGTDAQANLGIKRGSTLIQGVDGWDEFRCYASNVSDKVCIGRMHQQFQDSPGTTSPTTYTVAINYRSGTDAQVNYGASHTSYITLMEIAG